MSYGKSSFYTQGSRRDLLATEVCEGDREAFFCTSRSRRFRRLLVLDGLRKQPQAVA